MQIGAVRRFTPDDTVVREAMGIKRISPQPLSRLPLIGVALALLWLPVPAFAQQDKPGWQFDLLPRPPVSAKADEAPPAAVPPDQTTVVPRTKDADAAGAPVGDVGSVKVVALLTADGQQIDQGLVWRVFEDKPVDGKNKLIGTHKEASPVLRLSPGDYQVNVSFGRSNLTRKISIKSGEHPVEQFVLNAGGLRLNAVVGNAAAPVNSVSYDILTDERDQSDNRSIVMSNARPGLVIRLNAGIYHIVSTYGDANATVRADVTVEAGKLTEATIAHSAARVTLKLVTREGGEATPDTEWTIFTPDGTLVKQSVGALPTHMLAPGAYTAVAKSAGREFRQEFAVENATVTQVEVLMQ